jgi:hypothetical protein
MTVFHMEDGGICRSVAPEGRPDAATGGRWPVAAVGVAPSGLTSELGQEAPTPPGNHRAGPGRGNVRPFFAPPALGIDRPSQRRGTEVFERVASHRPDRRPAPNLDASGSVGLDWIGRRSVHRCLGGEIAVARASSAAPRFIPPRTGVGASRRGLLLDAVGVASGSTAKQQQMASLAGPVRNEARCEHPARHAPAESKRLPRRHGR